MNKLLPVLGLCAVIFAACGSTEQEKKAAQQEAEEKLNEIISTLEASAEETTSSAPVDSIHTDADTSAQMEEHGNKEGDGQTH